MLGLVCSDTREDRELKPQAEFAGDYTTFGEIRGIRGGLWAVQAYRDDALLGALILTCEEPDYPNVLDKVPHFCAGRKEYRTF